MTTAPKPKPWLIAAWPGMGNVAAISAGYLIQKLEMQPIAELPPRRHFDVPQVIVKSGVIMPPRLPRSVFYQWKNPGAGRDLVVFLGEAQPVSGAYTFAHELLDKAGEFGVERIVTFASMASQLHPSEDPKVFGAATGESTLAELRRIEIQLLEDGQIGGLNGVLLGAGSERSIPGLCLLGEIPFFAAGVPNPKAARAVLSVFSVLAGLEVNLDELAQHAEAVDRALLELLERMKQEQAEGADGPPLPEEPAPEEESDNAARALDLATRTRIEELFEEARRDRGKAVRLKEELDRHGVFDRYENRFLDLFKRAE